MVRSSMSGALAFLILLSQVGVPMHLHYCKGILESVSVFISNACEDHDTAAIPVAACCKKNTIASCHKEDQDCCHDQVRVLQQEIQSLIPYGGKWLDVALVDLPTNIFVPVSVIGHTPRFPTLQDSDSGPPRYILFHSLVYYG